MLFHEQFLNLRFPKVFVPKVDGIMSDVFILFKIWHNFVQLSSIRFIIDITFTNNDYIECYWLLN